jgi:hypothetical protein
MHMHALSLAFTITTSPHHTHTLFKTPIAMAAGRKVKFDDDVPGGGWKQLSFDEIRKEIYKKSAVTRTDLQQVLRCTTLERNQMRRAAWYAKTFPFFYDTLMTLLSRPFLRQAGSNGTEICELNFNNEQNMIWLAEVKAHLWNSFDVFNPGLDGCDSAKFFKIRSWVLNMFIKREVDAMTSGHGTFDERLPVFSTC